MNFVRPENFDDMDLSSQQIPSPPSAPSKPVPDVNFSNPSDYLSKVLKKQLGKSPEFVAFERHFYYQIQELNASKNTCEELRTSVSKLQEEKRSLELQLITEKTLRDQESKSAGMELEKFKVQQNAQMYSMKCEAETWKRKSEAGTTECSWLKEQLKRVEMEKTEAHHKLADLKARVNDFERYRQSFESYSKRLKETMQIIKRKLEELENAKDVYEKLSEANQSQLDLISSKLHNWIDERKEYDQKIVTLEQELMMAKADLVQNTSKLERAEMNVSKTAEFVDKLLEENKDLLKGLQILATAQGDRLTDADKQLMEKSRQLHQLIESSIERLHLKDLQNSPPSYSDKV